LTLPLACIALTVTVPAGSAIAAASRSCGHSNIDEDHITPANDFLVGGGISCANALMSATGYTDSAQAVNITVPGRATFTAQFYEWRYRWECKTVELTPRDLRTVDGVTRGTRFSCHAWEELGGHRLGMVSMTFKWWLPYYRSCSTFPLEQEGWLADQVTVTRNVNCMDAEEWIRTATNLIETDGIAYKVVAGTEYFDYFDSGGTNSSNTPGDGTPYECLTGASAALTEEYGLGAAWWQCFQPGRKYLSKEYAWRQRHQ
jgi:hypothetical protein